MTIAKTRRPRRAIPVSKQAIFPRKTTVADSAGSDNPETSDSLGRDLRPPSGDKPFRFRGRLPALEQGLAFRQDLAPPESSAAEPMHLEGLDLPPIADPGAVDLAAELAQDLERLREAADTIATTSDSVEQHFAETTTLDTKERVESSRGRRAPAPATPPATVGPRVATRGENTAQKQDAAPQAEHQEQVPMKTTTGKPTADMPQRNRTEEQPVTTGAGPATDGRSRGKVPVSQMPDTAEPDELSGTAAARARGRAEADPRRAPAAS